MTPTELFLIQLLKESEQVLAAAQRALPESSKYDSVADRISRKRGDISNAINFVMQSEEVKAQIVADLLRNNITELSEA